MLNPIAQLGPAPAAPPARTMADMSTQDFLQLLITQLQCQDPTQPVTNQDLLNQVTSIRQLQSTTDMSTSLSTMNKQQQIVSAGSLIGKQVQGLNDSAAQVSGTVTSVTVQGSTILLDLDSGQQVAISNLTAIAPAGTTTPTGN